MKIGLFDHVERADRPLAQLFDERLAFAAAADKAGIYCLHIAEHHQTPLNMVPVPGVYLGAVARLTAQMRLGTLVYLLPLYSPLRLIEEICMLDHLSHGRLDVGVGRGVSPFELGYHNVAADQSRDIFADAFACVSEGLTHDTLTHTGPFFTYTDVPMPLRPLQQPTPPFWYGSSSPTGSRWAGEQGMHFVANGPTAFARGNLATYREALAKRGGVASPKPEFRGGGVVGIARQVIVADTDAQAHAIGKPNVAYHLESLNWIRKLHSKGDFVHRANIPRGATFEDCLADGSVIAGSPATVRAAIERQAADLGVNYLLAYLFFGTMTLDQAMRSLALLRDEVMPKIAAL